MYAQECKKIPIKTTVENAEYSQCRDDQLLVVDGGEGVVEQKEEVVETVKCSVEIIMKSAAVGQNGFCGSTRKPEKNTR